MIARWREAGLVAGPEWHWDLMERRGVTITLDAVTAHRLCAEAERRGSEISDLVRDLLDADRRSPVAMSA